MMALLFFFWSSEVEAKPMRLLPTTLSRIVHRHTPHTAATHIIPSHHAVRPHTPLHLMRPHTLLHHIILRGLAHYDTTSAPEAARGITPHQT